MDIETFAYRYPELTGTAIVTEAHTMWERSPDGHHVERVQHHLDLWTALVESLGGDVESAMTYVLDSPESGQETALQKCGVRPTRVVVYQLDRAYGGPEEGGWWFDTGTVELDREIGADEDLEALRTQMELEYPNRNRSGSMAYRGGDYAVQFGYRPGADYPAQRPHFE